MASALIQSFTKTLQPCSGCGKTNQIQWELIPQKEGVMQFAANVVFEASDIRDAVNKIPEWMDVQALNKRPQGQPAQAGTNIPQIRPAISPVAGQPR